jgi:hypothetical protein
MKGSVCTSLTIRQASAVVGPHQQDGERGEPNRVDGAENAQQDPRRGQSEGYDDDHPEHPGHRAGSHSNDGERRQDDFPTRPQMKLLGTPPFRATSGVRAPAPE